MAADTARWVQFESRPFVSLLESGEMKPVDAAAIAYLPESLLRWTGLPVEAVVHGFCENRPLFGGLYETAFGRIAMLYLPRFDFQLHRNRDDVVGQIMQALGLAARLGARAASLTGMLPSLTAYGEHVRQAVEAHGPGLPRVTTGHATTAAAGLLALHRLAAEAGRDLAGEPIAFLGLGAIGVATLELMLSADPHPPEIVLCDVSRTPDALVRLAAALARVHRFEGRMRVLPSNGAVPDELFTARVVVSTSHVAGLLDVDRLAPGTLLVDDSDPRCFAVERAAARLERHDDLLFTDAAILAAAAPIRRVRYRPGPLQGASVFFSDDVHANTITSCILSSLLVATRSELRPSVGFVDPAASARHLRVLERLGFGASAPGCDGYVVPRAAVKAFRDRGHGGASVVVPSAGAGAEA